MALNGESQHDQRVGQRFGVVGFQRIKQSGGTGGQRREDQSPLGDALGSRRGEFRIHRAAGMNGTSLGFHLDRSLTNPRMAINDTRGAHLTVMGAGDQLPGRSSPPNEEESPR